MPASRLSFYVTDSYREQVQGIHRTTKAFAQNLWQQIDVEDPQGTYPLDTLTASLRLAQGQAVTASAAYLTAFLTSELDEPTEGPTIDTRPYVGQSRDGRSLRDALVSPLIAIRTAIKYGDFLPLDRGWQRANRMIGLEIDHAARTSLLLAMHEDDRFDGWRRALRGTCGACVSVAMGLSHALWFPAHPGCQCVSEPNVRGVGDRFPRPTGPAIFAAKTDDEQDEMLGPKAAQAVRDGLPLSALVDHSPQETDHDFITQGTVPDNS